MNTLYAIAKLVESTNALHRRFGVPDISSVADLDARIRMQAEELGELAKATSGGDWDSISEEAVDVLVIAIGTVLSLGSSGAPWIQRVVEKNDAKTDQTHEFVGGKIRRKVAGV